ncbi:3'-5' exonuclease [Streptomyces sp. V2]|uniref:3'-5' exonuclease n=1 Tax=Streptomyces sp. V2 TaxID=1424099 RepID=UPI00140380F1|nr:3'-5' exonuclease [Streptomyces sp. V2]
MTAIAFVDTETTGLDPIYHKVWEVAVIRREADGTETEHLWQIRPARHELAGADPEALRISRFEERFAVPAGAWAADMLTNTPTPMEFLDAARQIFKALTGTVMVGSNPHFDASMLHRLLQTGRDPWHYRPVCIATMAAIHLGPEKAGPMPWSSYKLSRTLGIEPPADGVAHTALGDARWARDVYDAVMGGAR